MIKSVLSECEQCSEKKLIPKGRSKCQWCRRTNADVKAGRMRAPDYSEVNVANFKEPLQKVDDGFGYYGAITVTNDDRLIQCHICGYYLSALGAHIVHKHKIDLRDYKLKYGLRLKDGLLSPMAKAEAQIRYNLYARKSPEEFKQMSVKAQKTRKETGYKTGGDMWTPQTYNEKGNCREQTIAKIRHIAEINGGIPTYDAYSREYGGLQVVYHWFGTWEKAVEAAGLQTYLQSRRKARKERMRDYISMIEYFYKTEGRTPQTSDFNSVEYLPSQRDVTSLFGSLNIARAAAKVPLLIYVKNKWVEATGDEALLGLVPSRRRRVSV